MNSPQTHSVKHYQLRMFFLIFDPYVDSYRSFSFNISIIARLRLGMFLLQFRVEIGIDGIPYCHRTIVMAARTFNLLGSTFAHLSLFPLVVFHYIFDSATRNRQRMFREELVKILIFRQIHEKPTFQ